VLGDMYELGDYWKTEHRQIGKTLAQLGIGALITVGELAGEIAEGARQAGYPENCLTITGSREEAAAAARQVLASNEPGMWVLLKGSRGMKMEEIKAWLEERKKDTNKGWY